MPADVRGVLLSTSTAERRQEARLSGLSFLPGVLTLSLQRLPRPGPKSPLQTIPSGTDSPLRSNQFQELNQQATVLVQAIRYRLSVMRYLLFAIRKTWEL